MTLGNLKLLGYTRTCHEKPDMSEELSTSPELLAMVNPPTLVGGIRENFDYNRGSNGAKFF
ncbi:hypothetical protein TorRG33x02_153140 [Trema orientale]|uniref:Uncharacterized protein n=1 Tax=Trema orientale TaxID=63057 RepID=A0A2P5ETP8_TREOI|nr:hypothetical protein TorRG33x02_153140 [Trema orientale]